MEVCKSRKHPSSRGSQSEMAIYGLSHLLRQLHHEWDAPIDNTKAYPKEAPLIALPGVYLDFYFLH